MKVEETDLFCKTVMTGSGLEIGKPDFNSVVMQKIMQYEKKKMMRRVIVCSFLGLLSLGIIIFLLIITLKPGTGSSGQIIQPLLNNIFRWIIANQSLIIPIILILVIQKLIGTKRSYA